MRVKLLTTAALLALGGLCNAVAQAPTRVYHVGFLSVGNSETGASTINGLTAALRRRNYFLGNNLVIDARFAEAKLDRLPKLIKELMDIPVDVISLNGYAAALAAKQATATVPIVLIAAGDPVQLGLVASYRQPGGNITGVSDIPSELTVKRLELITEAVGGLKRLAVLYNAADASMVARYEIVVAAASDRGMTVQPFGVRGPDDFESAFSGMSADRPDEILMVSDILTMLNRKRVFEFAGAKKIPAIYEVDSFARDGGLMSYGAERSEAAERAPDLIDRILKGAKPADLPIERSAHIKFVINLKTAKELGITLPPTLLARADEVIE